MSLPQEAVIMAAGLATGDCYFQKLRYRQLLAEGKSTAQIAEMLHLSRETVRNHVRGLLRALRQQSRIAAVAHARLHGLL